MFELQNSDNMKKVLLALLAIGTFQLGAQDLPAPSPFSKLEQRVGLTDFTVAYSRPGVKGREIYGDLVPYETLWRTGANKATAITFNTPVSFGGKEVAPGTYSIFTIPADGNWTVILNKNTELYGTDGYEEEKDVLRLEVEAMEATMTETFTIDFQDIKGGSANMVIRWADRMVAVPVMVDVKAKAMMNIKEALANSEEGTLWRVNRNAAIYYTRNDINQEMAMEYINTSIDLNKESWYSYLIKGEIEHRMGDSKAAMKSAEMAMELGTAAAAEAGEEFAYAGMVKEAMAEWSK